MSRPARLLAACAALALSAAAPAQPLPASVVATEHVRAELVADAPQGVAAGKPLRFGLALRHAPEWHTYWKNPGDSGLPTTFAWKLPAGFTTSEIRWPVPHAIKVGPLVNYGYDGEVLLVVDATVPASFAGDALDVRLKAEWLVCKDVCIPESGDFALRIPSKAASSGAAVLFAAAAKRQPQAAPGAAAQANVEGDRLVVVAERLPAAAQGRPLQFFAAIGGVIEHAAPVAVAWQGERWTAQVPIAAQRSESPAMLPALLVDAERGIGWPVEVRIAGWSGQAAAATAAAAAGPTTPGAGPPAGEARSTSAPADSAGGSSGMGLGAALGLALIGGLLLNLMPCVFPVLSLKLLSFADSHHDRPARIAGGFAYAGGVVASFVVLGGILMALRAGGAQLGWGFQLQSPLFVAGLALLFTVLGLNLAGVFEFGNVLPNSVACQKLRHPLADDVFTGILAVFIASPCTAPFMGAATGATLAMPPLQALAVFAMVGVGMALPYLIASVVPQAARLLPRPGPWLASFRTAMAFPMFATVVWLIWVLGVQAGIDGAAVLLAMLVAASFVVWAFATPGMGRRSRAVFGGAAALVLALTLSYGWPTLVYPLPDSNAASASPNAGTTTARWRRWSAEAVAEAQREGRTVFVDFTAAWCITCQVNKRTTLADDGVLADFRARDVVLMRADWTLRDARITAELARLGRTGVPVYAFYPPHGAAPRLLPEIISAGTLRDALAEVPPPTTPAKAYSLGPDAPATQLSSASSTRSTP